MANQIFNTVKEAVAHARGLLQGDIANYCDFQARGVRIVVEYNWDATRIDVKITTNSFDRIRHKTTSNSLSQKKAQEIIGDSKIKMVDCGL